MTLPRMTMRNGDIEVRTCDVHLMLSGDHVTADIIRWFKKDRGSGEYCISIAYWHLSKEGYDLHFVGNRPFQIPHAEFMRAAEFGQLFLDSHFDEQKP